MHRPNVEKPCQQGESWSFENDYLGRGKVGTDRWYTAGFHATWSFKRDWRSTAQAEPQLDNRPWGGFSFIGAGAFACTGRMHELAEFRLGLLGAASGAGETQRALHRLIDDDRPAGWHNQLRPRLGVQFSYIRTWRFYDSDLGALPPWAGLQLHGRGSLGNVGVDFKNRYSTFQNKYLRPWTVYTQLQFALVAHNALITGRTFTQRPQIELKRDVWMATLGLSFRCSAKTRLEYRIKWRSPEFEATGPAPDDR